MASSPALTPTYGGSERPPISFRYLPVPYRWRREMFFGKATKFGVGTAALALVAMAGIGFAPAPTQLQNITVYHNPT